VFLMSPVFALTAPPERYEAGRRGAQRFAPSRKTGIGHEIFLRVKDFFFFCQFDPP